MEPVMHVLDCSTPLEYHVLLGGSLADECEIYHGTHGRNVVFWIQVNLHFMVELQHEPPHVM
jgi:hypothetical protein